MVQRRVTPSSQSSEREAASLAVRLDALVFRYFEFFKACHLIKHPLKADLRQQSNYQF